MNLLIFGFPKRQLKQRTTLHNVLVFYCCDETSRHHKYGNPCKTKHLTGACLQLQRLSPLSVWQKYSGRQADVAQPRVIHVGLQATGKERCWVGLGHLKPQAYPQWHTFSKKATPTPARQNLLIQITPLPNDQAFKHMSTWEPFLFQPPHVYGKMQSINQLDTIGDWQQEIIE